MPNVSTQLSELAIIRSLLIQRVSNGLSQQVANEYQRIINDLDVALRSAKKINLKNLNATIADLKSRVDINTSFLYDDLKEFGVAESAYAVNSVNTVVGVEIFKQIPPESTIKRIVNTSLLSSGKQADTIKKWLDDVDKKMLRDIDKVVKHGIIDGKTNYEVAQTLTDVLSTNKRNAETITRTATSLVSNRVREEVYRENEDVIKGYEFMATLDSRTSFGCSTRDGAMYDTNNKGINAKGKQFKYESVPRHLNCRSIYSPVMKTFRELGIDIDEVPKGTRSSLDGQISADTNFDKWFSGKDKAFQEQYLGKGRFELYQKGTITFKDLVNQKGETLSISELISKHS